MRAVRVQRRSQADRRGSGCGRGWYCRARCPAPPGTTPSRVDNQWKGFARKSRDRQPRAVARRQKGSSGQRRSAPPETPGHSARAAPLYGTGHGAPWHLAETKKPPQRHSLGGLLELELLPFVTRFLTKSQAKPCV